MTWSAPGLTSRQASLADPLASWVMSIELQRPPSMIALVESKTFWVRALMSPTSNFWPFIVTACCGSGMSSEAGVQA